MIYCLVNLSYPSFRHGHYREPSEFCQGADYRFFSPRAEPVAYVKLDELIEFDIDVKEIQETIDRTSNEVTDKIDWTKAWSKKYPVRSECVPGLKRYSGGCMEGTERVIKPFPEPSPG